MNNDSKPVYMEERIENIEKMVSRILGYFESDNDMMHVSDIAKMCKVSPSSMYKNKRYLIPNFGVNIPKEGFSRREVMDWLNKGQAELYRLWKSGEHV